MMARTRRAGFTVVELLLGIALFAILIPALINALNSIAAANDNTKDFAIANIVAENKVEELRSVGYNSINTGTTDFSSSLPAALGITKTASYVVTTPVSGQKHIVITITFKNRRGTQTLNYKTIVGELGVGQ